MSPIAAAVAAAGLGLPAGRLAAALVQRHAGRRVLGAGVLGAMTALLWAALTLRLWREGLEWAVPAYLAFGFACVVLAVIDAATRLLPNRITYPSFPIVAVLLALASAGEGDPGRLGRAALAALAVGGLFLLLTLAYPEGMGLGDVKLAPTLALALGWLGWPWVVMGVVAAFLLGGLAGLVAIVVLRMGRKARVPFGPWLAAGAVLAVLAGDQLAAWYASPVASP